MRLILSFLMALFLSACIQNKYEKDFFDISEMPLKSDITMCSFKLASLFKGADENVDFLIDQTLNTDLVGTYGYPVKYNRSDVANYILGYRFGKISEYYPEFDSQTRFDSFGDQDKLRSYTQNLHEMWKSAKESGRLTAVKGVCD